MIRLPNSNELFRTINDIADGKADAKNNTIEPIEFMVWNGQWTTHKANSMWAATEWIKANDIAPHNVIWL